MMDRASHHLVTEIATPVTYGVSFQPQVMEQWSGAAMPEHSCPMRFLESM
jgi:hypothetical protein